MFNQLPGYWGHALVLVFSPGYGWQSEMMLQPLNTALLSLCLYLSILHTTQRNSLSIHLVNEKHCMYLGEKNMMGRDNNVVPMISAIHLFYVSPLLWMWDKNNKLLRLKIIKTSIGKLARYAPWQPCWWKLLISFHNFDSTYSCTFFRKAYGCSFVKSTKDLHLD